MTVMNRTGHALERNEGQYAGFCKMGRMVVHAMRWECGREGPDQGRAVSKAWHCGMSLLDF